MPCCFRETANSLLKRLRDGGARILSETSDVPKNRLPSDYNRGAVTNNTEVVETIPCYVLKKDVNPLCRIVWHYLFFYICGHHTERCYVGRGTGL